MIEGRQAAKDISFLGKLFDKCSKSLERILSDVKKTPPLPETMYTKEGAWVSTLEGKLNIFKDYYEGLYKGMEPSKVCINNFLGQSENSSNCKSA